MNFTGITFENQKVTPSDDGRLYAAILRDGILDGCGLTYAAATLSLAAGSMIIGSRQIKTGGGTVTVSGATSGYARVLVDLDLTKAATKESFLQAATVVEYSATVAGFSALTQQDLNIAGSHYQQVLCILSLGAAGITGIVSRLGHAAHDLVFQDVSVAASAWTASVKYPDFPYQADVPLAGVDESYFPDVVFAPEDALTGVFAPVAETYAGGVRLYASSVPSAATVIPTILIRR